MNCTIQLFLSSVSGSSWLLTASLTFKYRFSFFVFRQSCICITFILKAKKTHRLNCYYLILSYYQIFIGGYSNLIQWSLIDRAEIYQ